MIKLVVWLLWFLLVSGTLWTFCCKHCVASYEGPLLQAQVCVLEQKRNLMAHAQKPYLVFQRNGRVHLYRRGCQFSRLLAAEVCASAVVMLDRPCPIQCTTAGYPLHSPFPPSLLHPCVSVCHHIPFCSTRNEALATRFVRRVVPNEKASFNLLHGKERQIILITYELFVSNYFFLYKCAKNSDILACVVNCVFKYFVPTVYICVASV